MKQTAVDFAVNKLANLIPSGNQILIRAILIEAKEMEKEQQLELIQFLAEREDFKEHFSMSIFIAEDYLNQFKNK